MKIAVVATGAMGSVCAGLLARAGHEVWVSDTWQAHVEANARDGLMVSGPSGTFVVDTPSTSTVPRPRPSKRSCSPTAW